MEPFVPHGASITVQFLSWVGTSGAIVLIAGVSYLWRENGKLKKEKESEVVNTIKDSINNLSTTIETATEKFENALKETRTEFAKVADDMWGHIGVLREEVSWLTGQHEANHKIKYQSPEHPEKPKYDGPERRQHQR